MEMIKGAAATALVNRRLLILINFLLHAAPAVFAVGVLDGEGDDFVVKTKGTVGLMYKAARLT